MIIFLYGQDTYRSRQKLREIIKQYRKIHQSGLSLTYLEGENLKFGDFKEIIQQTSIFDEKKLLILLNVFTNQDFKEKFFKNSKIFLDSKTRAAVKSKSALRSFPPSLSLCESSAAKEEDLSSSTDTILFYEENEISGKDKFFNFLKTKAKTQNFQPLEGEKLKNWVRQELSEFKTEIDSAALTKLINFVGNDLWRLSNEISKLASFKKNKKGKEDKSSSSPFVATREINVEDVELLIKPKIETAIFKTIDAIAQKNKKQALLLIHQHLEKGDSPLYLLSMVNFQFRNLLIIKDLIERQRPYYSILKATKLHPFVVKKSYQQAQKFTLSELKKIYQKIFQADLSIKTGKITSETALNLLLTEI